MGVVVKRVALDFDWPLKRIWSEAINPYYVHRHTCEACDGTGYNPATRQIAVDWYDFAGTGCRWCESITQDEVDALLVYGRLRTLTHVWRKEEGWQPRDSAHHLTAAEVNEWAKMARGFNGHDAINRMICVETRAKRLGVWGMCEKCGGDGEVWDSPEDKVAAEVWQRPEPPAGEGWQLWENVSEGSPISPVFATQAEFRAYLLGDGYSDEDATRLMAHGFAWSMVADDGRVVEISGRSV